jgi:hypothetical protein
MADTKTTKTAAVPAARKPAGGSDKGRLDKLEEAVTALAQGNASRAQEILDVRL